MFINKFNMDRIMQENTVASLFLNGAFGCTPLTTVWVMELSGCLTCLQSVLCTAMC